MMSFYPAFSNSLDTFEVLSKKSLLLAKAVSKYLLYI
jgi:hypothetical protein